MATKVLNEIERKKFKPKNPQEIFSEQWEVNYLLKNPDNGLWDKMYEYFYTISKGKADMVKRKWESDHKNDEVTFINVKYQ